MSVLVMFPPCVSTPSPVDAIYMAITHCQTLYPDPELSDSEAEEEEEEGEVGEWDGGEGGGGEVVDLQSGEFFTTAEGLDHLSAQGQATLAHLERILQLPSPDQFESMVSNGDGERDMYVRDTIQLNCFAFCSSQTYAGDYSKVV